MRRTTFESLIAIIGFSCFLAMNSFSLWGFSYLPTIAFGASVAGNWVFPLVVCNSLSFIVFAYLDKRNPRFTRDAAFRGAVSSLATGALFLASFIFDKGTLLLIISACFTGIGTTCCFLCWMRTLASVDATLRQFRLICGSVLSVVPYLLFPQANQYALICFVGFLAFANLVSLRFLLKSNPGNAENDNLENSHSILHCDTIKKHGASLLCVAMIGIISPILNTVYPAEGESLIVYALLVHGSNILAATTLAIVWFFLKRKTTIKKAYSFIFPLLLTALFLFPFVSSSFKSLILVVGSFGFTFFSMVMMTTCIDISKKCSLRLVSVYSVFAAATYASRILGQGIALLITSDLIPSDTQIVFAAFFLLYGCSIVMFATTRKAQPSTPADSLVEAPLRADTFEPAQTPDLIDCRCSLIAEEYRLSNRQHEIMRLFAHGYDIPAIAKKLFISENTVRTHTKKLYLILGVHSKQEIIELINSDE